jgi:signal transduction histidine kinase
MLSDALGEGERLEYRPDGQPPVVVPVREIGAHDGDLTAERAVVDIGAVTVSYPQGELRQDVLRALSPLVLLALVLVALAGIAGWLLARRLARPFTELAAVAETLGRGHLDAAVPHYDIPEADAIARALEDGSARLQRMLRRERELSEHASHDLRTPITALRLTLEDLSLWPTTPPEISRELARIVGEVDRFSEAVSALVDAPAGEDPVELVDVTSMVRQGVQQVEGPGGSRVFCVEAPQPVLARVPRPLARRAIDLLLEQAADQADGEVAVEVLGGHGYVKVELRAATGAQGPVWDQAVGLAVELGGRLTSTRGADGAGTWTLVLPDAQPAG